MFCVVSCFSSFRIFVSIYKIVDSRPVFSKSIIEHIQLRLNGWSP